MILELIVGILKILMQAWLGQLVLTFQISFEWIIFAVLTVFLFIIELIVFMANMIPYPKIISTNEDAFLFSHYYSQAQMFFLLFVDASISLLMKNSLLMDAPFLLFLLVTIFFTIAINKINSNRLTELKTSIIQEKKPR